MNERPRVPAFPEALAPTPASSASRSSGKPRCYEWGKSLWHRALLDETPHEPSNPSVESGLCPMNERPRVLASPEALPPTPRHPQPPAHRGSPDATGLQESSLPEPLSPPPRAQHSARRAAPPSGPQALPSGGFTALHNPSRAPAPPPPVAYPFPDSRPLPTSPRVSFPPLLPEGPFLRDLSRGS